MHIFVIFININFVFFCKYLIWFYVRYLYYKVYKYKCCFHLGSAAVVVALFCFAVVKDRPGSETVNQGKNDKKKGTCVFFSTECLYRYISLLRVIFEILFIYIVFWKLLELITNIDILSDLMFFDMIDATYPVPMSLYPHLYMKPRVIFMCGTVTHKYQYWGVFSRASVHKH